MYQQVMHTPSICCTWPPDGAAGALSAPTHALLHSSMTTNQLSALSQWLHFCFQNIHRQQLDYSPATEVKLAGKKKGSTLITALARYACLPAPSHSPADHHIPADYPPPLDLMPRLPLVQASTNDRFTIPEKAGSERYQQIRVYMFLIPTQNDSTLVDTGRRQP